MSLSLSPHHVLSPTAESMTSTVVGGSRALDSRIDGMPTSPDSPTSVFGPGTQQVLNDGDKPYPPVIPPTHTGRTLIVCFDGTGDQFDNDNSNIVQLVALLKKDDRHQQLVYYQVRVSLRMPKLHMALI